IRDGLIEAVGTDVAPPADAVVIDGEGMVVWAGWIDPYSHLGMQQRREEEGGGGGFDITALLRGQQQQPGTGHPLELVHPQYRVTSELVTDDGNIGRRRELGFTAALAVPRDGIYRGASALIALRDAHPREMIIDPETAQHVGFDSGNFLGGYPTSFIGAMATVRQVMYDTRRYMTWTERYRDDPRGMARPDYNDAFAALARAMGETRVVVEANSPNMIERVLDLAVEFDVDPIIVGSGREYEVIELIRDSGRRFIIPVDYPDEPDVSDPERLPSVSLESLRHWEHAPYNSVELAEAGVTFAFTAYDLGNARNFVPNVRRSIDAGLPREAALAAVTTAPAAMLGVDDVLGTLEAGKIANVVVADGEPFAEETEIRHVFVDGHHYEFEAEETVGDPDAVVDPTGTWAVTGTVMGDTQDATWIIEGEPGDYSGRTESDRGTIEFESVTLEGNAMTVVIPQPDGRGVIEPTVVIEGDEFSGSATVDAPGGQTITISFEGERVSGPEGGGR
ncbi:MAG: amidohydrolase family protein, partial [Acidobacteriota bacterium]